MIVEPRSRYFMRHQIRFRAYHQRGLPLPFKSEDNSLDILDLLDQAIGKKSGEYVINEKDVVRIVQTKVYPRRKMAALLFRRSDPDASTPVFEHTVTKKLRRSDKLDEEGVAVSAHLFVHYGGVRDASLPTYHAILEEMPGLRRTMLQAVLTQILRTSEYQYTDEHGDAQTTHTLVEVLGQKSEKLSAALKHSSVPYVVLVRPGNIDGLDSEGELMAREQRMKVVLTAKQERAGKIIEKITSWARRHKWENVLVRLDLPEDRSRIVTLSRENDAKDVLFIRSQLVRVSQRLDPCAEIVNEEIATKAFQMFQSDGIV